MDYKNKHCTVSFKSPKARDTANIPLYWPYASNGQRSDLGLSLLPLEIRHGRQHEPAARPTSTHLVDASQSN